MRTLEALEKQLTALELKMKREVQAGRQNFPLQGKIKKLKEELFNLRNKHSWEQFLAN